MANNSNEKSPNTRVSCYLTFDDGPYPNTGEILNVLCATQVKATFYLTVKNLERQPSEQFRLVKRMIDEGHALGNHGYDHDPMTRKGYRNSSINAVKQDFIVNSEKLTRLFYGNWFIFPGFTSARLPGDGRFMKDYVNMIANGVKLPHIGWDVEFSTNGLMGHITKNNWQGINDVAGTISGFPQHNSIILLHDRHWRGKADKLKLLITKLKNRCNFLPMDRPP